MSVAVATSETVAPAAATLSKVFCSGAVRNATAQVLAAAHAQIQEMHANSGSRAVGYVIVVLLLYALALGIALIKETGRFAEGLFSQKTIFMAINTGCFADFLRFKSKLINMYVRQERYETRLYHIYDEFVRRDRFLRVSKRHSSVGHSVMFAGVTSTTNCEEVTQFPHPGVSASSSGLNPGGSGGFPYCGPSGDKATTALSGVTGPLLIPEIHLPALKARAPHPLSEDEEDDEEPIQEELLGIRVVVPVRREELWRQLDSTV